MIRVRFDTGLVLQYNDAQNVSHSSGHARLVDKSGAYWYAEVAGNYVIESVDPCRVYREGEAVDGAQVEALVRRNVRLQRMNRELRAKAKAKAGRRT